jgi:hypothetical protein
MLRRLVLLIGVGTVLVPYTIGSPVSAPGHGDREGALRDTRGRSSHPGHRHGRVSGIGL